LDPWSQFHQNQNTISLPPKQFVFLSFRSPFNTDLSQTTFAFGCPSFGQFAEQLGVFQLPIRGGGLPKNCSILKFAIEKFMDMAASIYDKEEREDTRFQNLRSCSRAQGTGQRKSGAYPVVCEYFELVCNVAIEP
jgi:hypothetical protein